MSDKQSKRKHLRFHPDPLDYAQLAVKRLDDPFVPDQVALIYDEAPLGGCALILLNSCDLQAGMRCRVKVGRMDPVFAEVAWIKEIEPKLIRAGFRYLD
jgi:hypothetical protein